MNRVFLGLGSNVGDRISYILKAIEEIHKYIGKVVVASTVYESKPWGVEDQKDFLNCVVEIRTSFCPLNLLKKIKTLEKSLGRKERFRWGPREIDVDILLYGSRRLYTKDLTIPHPRIKERDFVLVPLIEIDPLLKDPESGRPYSSFLGGVGIYLRPFCSLRPIPS